MAHRSAFRNAQRFYNAYVKRLGAVGVVEIGSQDVNGSIRQFFLPPVTYTGVDFADANGVDIVLDDPYRLPFEDASVDVLVCSSVFEHSEFFWLTFVEMCRVLKAGGLLFLNVPSNGPVHGYPVDCWRFYPDAGRALQNWAKRQGYDMVMLESYISHQEGGTFNDFVAVYVKGAEHLADHPGRIAPGHPATENIYLHGEAEIRNKKVFPEDQRALQVITNYVADRLTSD